MEGANPDAPDLHSNVQLDTAEDASPPTSEPIHPNETDKRGCCSWSKFEGNVTSQAYNVHGIARGPSYMVAIFLSTAFIYLAADEVGCVEFNEETERDEIMEDCDTKVHGAFSPAALVANIATISGVLVALFLPVAGAIIDFTPHRRTVGIVSAILLILTDFVQIFTNSKSWFAMAILEAISGLFFHVQLVTTLAYLPEIAKETETDTMGTTTAYFLMTESGSQALFVLSVVAISTAFALDDVTTAQVGQAIYSAMGALVLYLAWRKFPDVPAKHTIHKDGNNTEATHPHRSILVMGFIQNWETLKKINQHYKHSLRWFLLATAFGEAAALAFVTVAVVFLTQELGLSATEVGIFFLICIIFMPPSTWLGQNVAHWTNPSISWRLSMFYIFAVALTGALTLNRDNAKPFAFLWGASVACGLGWFYHSLFYYMSVVTPDDQANELAGFFNYCRLILAWLPPLLFSLFVEANVSLKYGVILVSCFFLISIAVLSLSPSWEEVMKEAHSSKMKATEDTIRDVDEKEEETPQVLPTPGAASGLDC